MSTWMQSAAQFIYRMAWPNIENPNTPLTGENLLLATSSEMTNSGRSLTVNEAVSYSPIWAAVQTISNAVARIPVNVYERIDDNGIDRRIKAKDHEAYHLLRKASALSSSAPRYLTANVWKAKMVASALLYDAGYSIIRRTSRDRAVSSLEWIPSWRVDAKLTPDDVRWYIVHNRDGSEEIVQRESMFVLHGLSIDNEKDGMSLVQYARHVIGRQLQIERYGDDFFKNHAIPAGWFQHPGEMGKEAQQRFLRTMVATHGGAGNRHKIGILEEGMTWKESSVSPRDALLIDQLKFGVPEVARYFSVPLHLLGDASRAGYNTTEAENNAFINMCLGNWMSRIEYEANDKLFNSESGREFYAEFQVDAVLKANTLDRHNAYAIAIQNGILNRNEVRARENLDPYDGGDEFLTPMNHNVGEPDPAAPDEPIANDEPADDMQDTSDAQREIIAAVMARMAKRINGSALKAASKPDTFMRWVNRIGELHTSAIGEAIDPCVRLAATVRGIDVNSVRQETTASMIDAAVEEFENVNIPGPLQRDADLRQRVSDAGETLTRRFDAIVDEMMKGTKNGNQKQHAAG